MAVTSTTSTSAAVIPAWTSTTRICVSKHQAPTVQQHQASESSKSRRYICRCYSCSGIYINKQLSIEYFNSSRFNIISIFDYQNNNIITSLFFIYIHWQTCRIISQFYIIEIDHLGDSGRRHHHQHATTVSGQASYVRKRAEYGFGEYGFKHVSLLAFAELRGENSVPKRTHRVFPRTFRVCRKTQWGSVSFFLRNSTLETVFCLFPICPEPTMAHQVLWSGHENCEPACSSTTSSTSHSSMKHKIMTLSCLLTMS